MSKDKREGYDLPFKSFVALDGTRYLVFRTEDGSFHVFKEVEAKEAAENCGVSRSVGNTRQMWESIWGSQP